jgi:hypothetical protein
MALVAALLPAACGAGVDNGALGQPVSASVTDLAAAERLGGHTLARHVGKTDGDLRDRLRREPDISAVSTYADRQTAERVITETLRRFSGRVESWSARTGSRPNLALEFRGDGQARRPELAPWRLPRPRLFGRRRRAALARHRS